MYRVTFLSLVATVIFYLVVAAEESSSESTESTEASCGNHESSYPCGTRCELNCNHTQPGHCVGTECPGYECRCDTGYVRGPDQNCILAKDCPINCPEGSVADSCGFECQPTCANRNTPEMCYLVDCNPNAPKRCRCKYEKGWVRDEKTNECVMPDDCS